MPRSTVAGHPLHPQLIGFPLGLLPMSFLLDLLYLVRRDKYYSHAAFYTMVAGYLGGLAAAGAGATDYLSIPSRSQTKRVATLHGGLNLGLLALLSVNLMLRAGGKNRWGFVPFLMSAVGNAGLGVSSWYGGQLVYEHGVRVKGVSEVEDAPEIKPPADDKVKEAMMRLEEEVEQLVAPLSGNSR